MSRFRTEIQHVLDEFRALASDARDQGTRFEKMVAEYLRIHPYYAVLFSDVWMWRDWPDRWGADTGIDLVARERDSGNYWAIQCKFLDPATPIQKPAIDSFISASGRWFSTADGKRRFSNRLVVTTAGNWGKHALSTIEDQDPPVVRIGPHDLDQSPVDWSRFRIEVPEDLRLRSGKNLYPHQREAIDKVTSGLAQNDRGRMIMACGTGKTYTSLKLMEELVPPGGHVLFLAPSITLVSQTLREWTAEAADPIRAFVVCSDSKVGRDREDNRIQDMPWPATTDAGTLADQMTAAAPDRRRVIFSTYQSIEVVAEAQRQAGLPQFDLIICDEAHRTTGVIREGQEASCFVMVHDNARIRAKKRLYMTATPRIYMAESRQKAGEKAATLYSMDDGDVFGPEFHRLDFGTAVERDLLSEYKVLIVAVAQNRMGAVANSYNTTRELDAKTGINIDFATKIIGSWKGLSKQALVQVDEDGRQEAAEQEEDTAPMRRAVAFSRSIKASKAMAGIFPKLVGHYLDRVPGAKMPDMVDCALEHVDGTMDARQRTEHLDWLKDEMEAGACRILSNARCLSEGVDVPALDAVIFFDKRESVVDIVQAVGRVMRKADGKRHGYIILPVCLPSEDVPDYNAYIDNDPQFRGIWNVLNALLSHDDRLQDEVTYRHKIKVISGDETDPEKGAGDSAADKANSVFDFPALPIEAINDAVYGVIPKHLGTKRMWRDWAKKVVPMADRLKSRIRDLVRNETAAHAMAKFLSGLRDNLNPAVTEEEAIDMLVQHTITWPVFDALFHGSFTENNPVSRAMQQMTGVLDTHAVGRETGELETFYQDVQSRVSHARSDKSRQNIIRELYDTFFNNAFPRLAQRLGIVYTPVEIVDFIIHSADVALRRHFGTRLGGRDVQILDPFTGTGTFMVRLLQSGLIDSASLSRKYGQELHANEIVLLAYYIATVNIEGAWHDLTGEYRPFDGIVLTDSFQMNESADLVETVELPENSARVNRQKAQPVRVVIGNPPWSAQQQSENDDNQNLSYPCLDAEIRDSYAAKSNAKLKKNLYDSYIRAIRLASNRIAERGIVALVTNASFIDGNSMDGLRKSLTTEFSHLYILNLRGNQRTAGDISRREGGKIFGSGSRAPVAITLMIRDPDHKGPCQLHYHDIGDYVTRERKLEIIQQARDIDGLNWQSITPNDQGDWINQRDPEFDQFIPLGDKEKHAQTVFSIHSLGIVTARDAWAYNFSRDDLAGNMRRMIDACNTETEIYRAACRGHDKTTRPRLEDIVNADPTRINWSRGLKKAAQMGKIFSFDDRRIVTSSYRPFTRAHLYFDQAFNEMVYQIPRLFPTPEHNNMLISATGRGANKPFSCLATNRIPDYEMISKGQCFPRWWYEKTDAVTVPPGNESTPPPQISLEFQQVNMDDIPDKHGYIRRDAITDWALARFRRHYGDAGITKDAIFWYVYGLLHSPEYRDRFAASLKKMLPRIPLAADFPAFADAGRQLGQWHLEYETVDPWPLDRLNLPDLQTLPDCRVQKMAFGKKSNGEKDKSVIVCNPHLTLRNIPDAAYGYSVNGKSAIEWLMDRYQVRDDKDSGIRNDPNLWSDDPHYIVNLLRRIIRVSVETTAIVESLPPLDLGEGQ